MTLCRRVAVRCGFIAGLTGSAAVWRQLAHTQPAGKTPVVGILGMQVAKLALSRRLTLCAYSRDTFEPGARMSKQTAPNPSAVKFRICQKPFGKLTARGHPHAAMAENVLQHRLDLLHRLTVRRLDVLRSAATGQPPLRLMLVRPPVPCAQRQTSPIEMGGSRWVCFSLLLDLFGPRQPKLRHAKPPTSIRIGDSIARKRPAGRSVLLTTCDAIRQAFWGHA